MKGLSRRKSTIVAACVVLAAVVAAGWMWRHGAEARGWERDAKRRADEGRWEEAKRLLDQARGRITVDPALYASCEKELAAQRALADAKRLEDEVFGPIRERIRALPDNTEGRRRAVQLIDEGLARFAGSWDAWMRKGEVLAKIGRTDEALAAFGRALVLNPRLGMARYRRGRLLMDAYGRHDEALREFEAAQAEPGGNEYAALGRARIAVLNGDPDLALTILAATEPSAGHVSDLYFVRGYIRSVAGSRQFDAKRAIADYDRAIEMDPDPVAYMNRGAVKYHEGDYKAAIDDCTRALKIAPLSGAHFNRGLALEVLGERAGAEEDINEALRLEPVNAEALAVRGRLRAGRGDHAGAIDDCGRALAINADCTVAYSIRGDTRRAMREFAEAVRDYDCALKLDPKQAAVFINRANAKIGLGDFDGAVRDHTQAIALRPTQAEAYAGRAEATECLIDGNPGKEKILLSSAERDLEKALEVAPADWRFRGVATERLEEIRRRLGK